MILVRALAGILGVTLSLLVSGCSDPPSAARTQPSLSPTPRPRAPVVMFLGDSYTTGVRDVTPDETYASQAARILGWQVIVAGHAGTGFVSPGKIGRSYAQLFDEQLAWRPAPDMLIISGGHNDLGYRPTDVRAAASDLLQTAMTRWPGAHVVVMGPMWGSTPPASAYGIRDALRTAAARANVPFIDPIAEEWITGNREWGTGNAARYILPDGTHPNAAGNRYLAERLAADLRRLGLDAPVLGRPAPQPSGTP